LAELDCLYPKTPGRTRHARLGLFVQPVSALDDLPSWHRQGVTSPKEFRQTFRRRLIREINQSGLTRVLMSDEALYGSADAALQRLRRLTDRIARTLRVVVYLRRQDDHLVSRYQQVVKVGETRRLDARTRQLDLSKTYDYDARLSTWQRLVEPSDVVVRRFEKDSFAEGSLYQDFLDAAGIDARAEHWQQTRIQNESLDAEAVEFIRICNIYRGEGDPSADLLPANQALVKGLAPHATGPTLTLPDAVLDEFMSQWEESNRRVARHFLADESGDLFRTPRKSRHTTTEQRLDPARLDHFLGLLELPEQTHAALRALVEREARTA
jgi:hypothetical protein